MQSFHHVPHRNVSQSVNPGTPGDVSLHLGVFHRGLRGGPWRDVLDPALVTVAVIPGTSIGIVEYDGVIIGCAHVDQFGNIGMVSVNEKFAAMVERLRGTVAA